MKRFLLILCATLLASAPLAAKPHAAMADPLYVVEKYDPKRDPSADVKLAITRATAENKRILLIVGGDWCVWCKMLGKFIHDDAKVHDALEASFVVVKVHWSREVKNEAFLKQFPPSDGYPNFFILESDGKFLAVQPTDVLEKGRGYDASKLIAFAQSWDKP